tara:strand:+ start:17427 stop:18335 length:909 start_codon:yes stop_codon:yes gene_type:complete
LKDFEYFTTEDGTLTLKSIQHNELFHSQIGAIKETNLKFINPSEIKSFNKNKINILDICFGLGYNSGCLYEELFQEGIKFNAYGLEITKEPLGMILKSDDYKDIWSDKTLNIIEEIYKNNECKNDFFSTEILWGDARKMINIIPKDIRFDIMFLDAFSPQSCPELWTVEFLSKLVNKMGIDGKIITYSSSAAVRKVFFNLNLEVNSIKPICNRSSNWSNGTVAIRRSSSNTKQSVFYSPLSEMEKEHLFTKASIPYRDLNTKSTSEDIIHRRKEEQKVSDLESTSSWKRRWLKTNHNNLARF